MDSQWLKTQFSVHPDKSKAALADALGLEPPAISKMIKGTRQIKAQEYIQMRRFFGLPTDGESALTKTLSTAYTIQPLDARLDDLKEDSGGGPQNWILPAEILNTRTQAPPDKIRIFQVRENVMEPLLRQGEHVLVDLSDKTPSPPGCFVISDGFGFMIRDCAYVPQSEPPKIRISAAKTDFQSQILQKDEFEITGRVIAKLQMI